MDILNNIEKKRKEEKEIQEQYKKDLKNVKRIIKDNFNNPNGFFVFDFLKKYLFNIDNNDLNPQMLAYEKGKRVVYEYLLSLLDEEILINYLKRK